MLKIDGFIEEKMAAAGFRCYEYELVIVKTSVKSYCGDTFRFWCLYVSLAKAIAKSSQLA